MCKSLIRGALAALLCIALVACGSVSTSTPSTPTQQIATGCASASAALKGLTVANIAGKLSEDQQTQVLAAANLVNPICASPTPPTLDTVKLAAFLHAITILQTQAEAIKGATP